MELPEGLLDNLFPPTDVPVPAAGDPAADPLTQAGENGEVAAAPSRGTSHQIPLLAGLAVTLVVLVGGGGFLWWRNRDANFFPA